VNVELHIDELVLHGFEPGDRWPVADAVQRELTRLLAERGMTGVVEPVEIPHLDAGSIALPSTHGQAAGAPIASALHTALGAPPEPPR
jgi:hypothetical protein